MNVPTVTSTSIKGSGTSAEIHGEVTEHVEQAISLYTVNIERLKELQPDLIVTQAQCDVCAITEQQIEQQLKALTGCAPRVVSFSPETFKQVLDEAFRLAKEIGRIDTAMRVIARYEARLQSLLRSFPQGGGKPSVICIEWMNPLMVAGHWIPDCVRHAGGRPLLSEAGGPSMIVDWAAITAADPDVICVMPCGFQLDQVTANFTELISHPGWDDLRAVREGRVFAFDGNAFFNRPGPRLYRSIELLARALHPNITHNTLPPAGPGEMAAWSEIVGPYN